MTHIFIVNPTAGKRQFAEELRHQLEKMDDLDYYVFNTRYAGYEEQIVRQVLEVFPDEKLRFYSCGGSGTLRNMLNGFSDFENVEIAMYPQGIANDFVQMFPEDAERFYDIEELIHGDVLQLDYIATNHGICLNHFSTGIDALVIDRTTKNRESCLLNMRMPYIFPVLRSLILTKARELIVTIDGKRIQENMLQLIVGNGRVLGGNLHFAENPEPADGEGEYYYVVDGNFRLPVMTSMYRADFSKMREQGECGKWKKVRIVSRDGKPIPVNQDGVLITDYEKWEIELVPSGLPFVVPKGVTV